jgi:dUTP pyrophosphatase
MKGIESQVSPEIWAQIQEQFEKIQSDSGVQVDEDYQKELEQLFGMTYDEMNREAEIAMKTRTLQVELIHEDAKFPTYAYPSDSGFDLTSVEDIDIVAFGRALVPTGIKLSIPEEYEIQVRPKSGLALNYGLTVLNTPGTIDSGYNGEIKVIVFKSSNGPVKITKGMKVAQAVLCPVMNGRFVSLEPVEQVAEKERGDNGFGSTGIK